MKNLLSCAGLLFSVTSMAATVSMSPLEQSFSYPEQENQSGEFTVGSKKTSFHFGVANNAELSFRLPSGEELTEVSASSHGFIWESFTSLSEPSRKLISLKSDTADSGKYAFNINSGTSHAIVSAIQLDGIQHFSMLGVVGTPVTPNTNFAVSTLLIDNGAPALGASIIVSMVSKNGILDNVVVLNDDGQSPDQVANDGQYSGFTSVPNTGLHFGLFDVDYNGRLGRYSRKINIQPTVFGVTGEFDYQVIDKNSDGNYEKVEFTFIESVPRVEGEYAVTLTLSDTDGKDIYIPTIISDPTQQLKLTVGVEDLKKLGTQPWAIKNVSTWVDSVPIGAWHINKVFDVDSSKFERPPIDILGVSGARGVDTNGDGQFESLQVDFKVNVARTGGYGISTDIRTSDGSKIISSSSRSWNDLRVGQENTVTFDFLGADFGASGSDGPYKVTNFLIYPNFSWSDKVARLVKDVGEVSGFTCDQFVGCNTGLASEILRTHKHKHGKHGDRHCQKKISGFSPIVFSY